MSSLEEQINQANGIKQCSWVNCSARFFEFQELFDHLKEVHVNAQPANLPRDCRWGDRCNYQTTEKKHLISHLRSHLDWRPYSCDICDGKFKHEHEIRRHKDRLHSTNNSNTSNTLNTTPPNNHLTPPLVNSGHSSAPSPSQLDTYSNTYSNALTPEMHYDTDKVLTEIIEYALGYKNSINVNESFKKQLGAIALPLNIIDIPQSQLKRHVIDSFHQSLLLSVASTTNQSTTFNQISHQNIVSPNLFDPSSYIADTQPLIDGYNNPNMSFNDFGFGFNNNNLIPPQQPDPSLFNFPTPPNQTNFNTFNDFNQNQPFFKQDPLDYGLYTNNMNNNMNYNMISIQQNTRSISPIDEKVKMESISPTLTDTSFRTRGLPPVEVSPPNIQPKESKEAKSESSSPTSANLLSSFMPNVMNFLKFPNITPTRDDTHSPNSTRSISPKPTLSHPNARSLSPSGSNRSDDKDSEGYESIYLNHKLNEEKAIETNLPIIRQEDGSFDIYKPKFVTPENFPRSPSKKGNLPLTPDEYLLLSMSKLKI